MVLADGRTHVEPRDRHISWRRIAIHGPLATFNPYVDEVSQQSDRKIVPHRQLRADLENTCSSLASDASVLMKMNAYVSLAGHLKRQVKGAIEEAPRASSCWTVAFEKRQGCSATV